MSQWDEVSETFARLSLAADTAPPGPERVRGHEAALRHAQASGSFAEELVARLDLTQALMGVPSGPEQIAHVGWLREALHTHPQLAPADRDAVLLRLGWAVDLLEDTPELTLEALTAAIDDLEVALSAEGDHLRPVHAARARLARATGDAVGVGRELAAWDAAPLHPRRDCAACEVVGQAGLVEDDDPDRALLLVGRVLRGELTCGEGPASAAVLDAHLRLARGDVDAAVVSFRRAWPLTADSPVRADTVAACLRVLLRLGNPDRAVDLLLPRLGWLDELRTPRERMWFGATAGFVLEVADAMGFAPAEVDGRPCREVAAGLRGGARDLACAFDARYRSAVTSAALAAAHDRGLVADRPTLPPTRLPRPTGSAWGEGTDAVEPTTGVVARAVLVRAGLAAVDADLEGHVRAWLRDRESLPAPASATEWAAVSLLDRTAAQDVDDPTSRRALLGSALDAARRADDQAGAARCSGELALLEVASGDRIDVARVWGRVRACAERLEASGEDAEAGALWRRLAWLGRPPDPARHLDRAAAACRRAGLEDRSMLCTIEAATFRAASSPGNTPELDAVESAVLDRPVLHAMVLEARARLARADGHLDGAASVLRRGLALRRLPDRLRHALLLSLGEVLVDQGAWDRLEAPGADVVAGAVRTGDPVLLAHGQRLLGLAYLGTGRPVEAAELLAAAAPVLGRHAPALVGTTRWALGEAHAGEGRWEDSHASFVTASAELETEGRMEEAAHCRWQAGTVAWDAGDLATAASHLDAAVAGARGAGAVELFVEALRSRAGLRVDRGDLAGGLAELDHAIEEGERLAAKVGVGEEEFDGEALEPDVLRQGAHLLAVHGHVDAAVARLGRAESLVGAGLELVLRAEAAAVLADHDRLEEAEPRLRAALRELSAGGLVDERVVTAGVLARALERAGRAEEAEEVWQRYGASG